jgi:hypothetical protein
MTDKNKIDTIKKIFLDSWRPYLWIIVIGSLVYWRAASFGLTYLDDNYEILNNAHFGQNLSNIFQAFRQNILLTPNVREVFYRPIATITDILDFQLGGSATLVFHVTNIILHLINSCLLFLLLVKLGYRKSSSFFCSMAFTVHPALAQNVAWIPGRSDSLLALFVLPAFICFLFFLETKQWRYYFLHMLFFAFSLFTKEIAPVIIPLALLYIYIVSKENLFSFNAKILTAGWLPLLALWSLMMGAASSRSLPVVSAYMIKNVFLNLSAVIIYAGKLLLPFNLSVMAYMRDSSPVYGFLALVFVAALLIFSKRKRSSHIIFGSVWFILFLLPAFVYSDPSGFGDYVYEHRIYLPAIGFIVILLETDLIKELDLEKVRPLFICGLIIAALSLMTFIHCGDFSDKMSFYESAVRTSPHSPLAHKNLGAMYYLDGLMDKSEFETEKAIALNPSEPMAHNNLGLVYMNKGMFKQAESEILKEISINPDYADAYSNLSLVYAKEKMR